MNILVVGGTGFLGKEISTKLVNEGNQVKSLNRSHHVGTDIDQTLGDINTEDTYLEFLKNWKPEAVIQTAWVTDQSTYRNSRLNYIYSDSTLAFAQNCFHYGTEHFIALGSCAEYGNPQGACNAASTPTNAIDLYGESKLRTLSGLQSLASKYEKRLTWARVFQPYGRHQDPARLIPSTARKLAANENVLITHPNTVLDWVTSRDVASAISFAVVNKLPQIVDIGTSIGTSILSTLLKLSEVLHADASLIHGTQQDVNSPEAPNLVVSRESPLLAAGWTPHDNLMTGIPWALSL